MDEENPMDHVFLCIFTYIPWDVDTSPKLYCVK